MHERRQVLIYPGESPSLPGCISQGPTKAEALDNIREAIDLYIEPLREDGMAVPEDRFQAKVVAV